MRVLSPATRLLFENLLAGRGLRNRFAIGDPRLADIGFDAKLALHAIDDNLEVQFAHAGDDRLAGFLIGRNNKRRILLRETSQRDAQLVLIGARLGLDSYAND